MGQVLIDKLYFSQFADDSAARATQEADSERIPRHPHADRFKLLLKIQTLNETHLSRPLHRAFLFP